MRRRQTFKPEVRAVQELPLDLFASPEIERRSQWEGEIDEEARWTPLGADDLNFHHIFSLHNLGYCIG